MSMQNRIMRKGIYRLTDRICLAYYEGNDQAMAQAIEDTADATGYESRAQKRANYRKAKQC